MTHARIAFIVLAIVGITLSMAYALDAPADKYLPVPSTTPFVTDAPEPADFTPSGPGASSQVEQQAAYEWVEEPVYGQVCRGRGIPCQWVQTGTRWVQRAIKPVRTATVLFAGGIKRLVTMTRPFGVAESCTASTTDAKPGDVWYGTDGHLYQVAADGTWQPRRANTPIPPATKACPCSCPDCTCNNPAQDGVAVATTAPVGVVTTTPATVFYPRQSVGWFPGQRIVQRWRQRRAARLARWGW